MAMVRLWQVGVAAFCVVAHELVARVLVGEQRDGRPQRDAERARAQREEAELVRRQAQRAHVQRQVRRRREACTRAP